MGRTLQNTMVNLALENACDEATYQVRQRIMGESQVYANQGFTSQWSEKYLDSQIAQLKFSALGLLDIAWAHLQETFLH